MIDCLKSSFSFPACRLALLSLTAACSVISSLAQTETPREVKIPYALSWGDPLDKIHDLIAAVKGRELETSETAPGKVVIVAEGLGVGDTLLKKSLFTFRDGGLVEVELQYDDPVWDADKAIDFFDRTRRRIDERYGSGTLLVNKVKEHPSEGDVPKDTTYTLIIYRWTQPVVALELNFYSCEDQAMACRVVSLIYKTP
jgi:hypothetical protein